MRIPATALAALLGLTASCKTDDDSRTSTPLEAMERREVMPLTAPAKDAPARKDGGGYFVSIAADAMAPKATVSFFDELYAAVDAYNRRSARDEGRLDAYVEEHAESGYTHLATGDDEIECDRLKCLVKLTARSLSGKAGSFAELVVQALRDKGIKGRNDPRDGGQHLYLLGDDEGLHVLCSQRGAGHEASYRCDFALDGALAAKAVAIDEGARGKLASCDMAPGTVRDAEEAKAQLERGGLLALTASAAANSKTVGYVRYSAAAAGGGIELLDVYLCGDLSQDHFQVDGEARRPRRWLPISRKKGARQDAIGGVSFDEVALQLSSLLIDDAKAGVTLEVRFKVVEAQGAAPEGQYGDDRFFVRFQKSWL